MENFKPEQKIEKLPDIQKNINGAKEVLKEYSENPEYFEILTDGEQSKLKANLDKLMNGFLVLTGSATVTALAGDALEKALEVAQNNDTFFETSGGVMGTGVAMAIITALGVYEGVVGAKGLLKNKKEQIG